MSGIFIGGRFHENTRRVCRRCKSPVWASEVDGYAYQCLECDEDLFEIETDERDAGYVPKVVVMRHYGGITINNELETLLDADGNDLIFDGEKLARDFLHDVGLSEEDMEFLYFVEFENMPKEDELE